MKGFPMIIVEINKRELKMEITKKVLTNLPKWFGIPESTEEYITNCADLPYWACYIEEIPVGFLSAKQNTPSTGEIYVMGIEESYHRKGIGKALFQRCYEWCKENNLEFLQVKTLDSSSPDPNYAITRKYYEHMGFKPFEVFDLLWGTGNPCLIMVKHIT